MLLVAIGIPVLMPGMGSAGHDCGLASTPTSCAVAVLASTLALVVAVGWTSFALRHDARRPLLLAVRLERPPRLV
ncbi:MAG: hypothetical protein ACT4PW_14165 [Acidimicrobiia bacterium]